MSTPINDGGPAFPCHTNPLPGKLANAPQGMSIRDYFAGQALAGLCAHYGFNSLETDAAKGHIHAIADAMIAAREVKA